MHPSSKGWSITADDASVPRLANSRLPLGGSPSVIKCTRGKTSDRHVSRGELKNSASEGLTAAIKAAEKLERSPNWRWVFKTGRTVAVGVSLVLVKTRGEDLIKLKIAGKVCDLSIAWCMVKFKRTFGWMQSRACFSWNYLCTFDLRVFYFNSIMTF